MRTKKKAEIPGFILATTANYLHSGAVRSVYVGIALIFPVLIAFGSWLDSTWRMSGTDKGFTQYYGFWAIFATTPVILVLTSYLFDYFSAVIQRHIKSLSLGSRSAWILVFLIIILLYWWLFNINHTISPVPKQIFNHDVFDSSEHHFGFYITRAYVFFMFVFVYCPAIFIALHITASMISILKLLCDDDMLLINLFHPDNCGGTSSFGKINLLILSIYGIFFLIIYAMYMTHGQAYLAISVSLAACSILAVIQSVAAVYYIHKAVAQKKSKYIEAVTERLNEQVAASIQSKGKFPDDLLTFRNHLMGLHTFPYTSGALIVVNTIRFVPAALAVVSLFHSKYLK